MKSLNIWSKSDEEIGRLLSNFAHLPFELDGLEYASVEAFYASILIVGNDEKRNRVRGFWGIKAKRYIPKNKPETFEYHGEEIGLGSDEHHALVKRAIRAKLEAHPEVLEAFLATRSRPLVHETGYPEKPGSEFPHAVFCRILSELRDELANAGEE